MRKSLLILGAAAIVAAAISFTACSKKDAAAGETRLRRLCASTFLQEACAMPRFMLQ